MFKNNLDTPNNKKQQQQLSIKTLYEKCTTKTTSACNWKLSYLATDLNETKNEDSELNYILYEIIFKYWWISPFYCSPVTIRFDPKIIATKSFWLILELFHIMFNILKIYQNLTNRNVLIRCICPRAH